VLIHGASGATQVIPQQLKGKWRAKQKERFT
jgi:hypothetical protein